MQSVVVYGRLFARAVFTGFTNDFQHAITWRDSIPSHPSSHARELHLVTAAAGIAKGHLPHQIFKKWSFGDDACFVAGQKKADVIGKCFDSCGLPVNDSSIHVFLFGCPWP